MPDRWVTEDSSDGFRQPVNQLPSDPSSLLVSRHLAFGDIHGCYDALRTLCALVRLRRDDTLIFLGDYVNKGPDSKAVLDEILRLDRLYRLIPLRGNHDILMHRARTSAEAYHQWLQSGGNATLSSYTCSGPSSGLSRIPPSHWHFLEHRLLPFHATATHIFVHAGVHPDLPLDQQPEMVLFHDKGTVPRPHCSGKIVIHGHTAQKSGLPAVNGHAICLDTWCYGKGWLTCLDVDAGLVYQATQHRQTRKFRLDTLYAQRRKVPIAPENVGSQEICRDHLQRMEE